MVLKLHPGPTGEIVHTTDPRMDEQIDTAVVDDFNAGLLLEYDPSSGYVWSFVNVYRSDPEQFIATYETDGSTTLNEFQQRVREAVEDRGWSIREGVGGGQVVFDNLTSTDPTGPPISEEMLDKLLDRCGTLSFAVPDELTAVRLFRHFYDRYGDDRSYAICRQPPSQFDTSADIYIEPNEQFDTVQLTGQAADTRRNWKVDDAAADLSESVDALASAAGEKLSGRGQAAGVVAALRRQGFDESFPVAVRQEIDPGVNWEAVAKTGLFTFALAFIAGLSYAAWRGSFTELASLATDSITYTFPPYLSSTLPAVQFTTTNWYFAGPLLAFLAVTILLKRRVRVPLRRGLSRLRSLLSRSSFPAELDRRAERVVADAESLETLTRSTDEFVKQLSAGFTGQRVEVSTTDQSRFSEHSSTVLGVVAGTAVAAVLVATASAITGVVVDNWNPVVDGLVVVTALWLLVHVAYAVGTLAGRLWPSGSFLRLPLRLFTPPSSSDGSGGQSANRDTRLDEVKRLRTNVGTQTRDTPSPEQIWQYIDDESSDVRVIAADAAKKLDDSSSVDAFDKTERQKYKQILRNKDRQQGQRNTRPDSSGTSSKRPQSDERSQTRRQGNSAGEPADSSASDNAPKPAPELDPVTERTPSQTQSRQRTGSTPDRSVGASASGGVADRSTTPVSSQSSGSAPVVRYDRQNTGSTPDPGPGNFEESSTESFGSSAFVGGPVSDGEFVCVADRDGRVYVYDLEARETHWRKRFSSVTAPPCLHDGNVYVPIGGRRGEDPRLAAFDLRHKARQGQFRVSAPIESPAVPSGNYIYFTDQSGRLHVAPSGLNSQKRFTQRFRDMVPGRPVIYQDAVYLADGVVCAVDASSGDMLQADWNVGRAVHWDPVVRNETLFAATDDRVVAFHSNPRNGIERVGKRSAESGKRFAAPPVVSTDRVVLCYRDGGIRVYSTNDDLRWSEELDCGITSAPTLTEDGRLYVAGTDGGVRLFSPGGNQRDVWGRPNEITHSPTVIGDRLLVADADRQLHILKEG